MLKTIIKYRYLVMGLFVIILIFLINSFNKPKDLGDSFYIKVQEKEQVYENKPDLVESPNESNEINSKHSLRFKFSENVDPDNITVSVTPNVAFKVTQYQDKSEIWVLPTKGGYWENGTIYTITVDNKDVNNPEIKQRVSHIHNYWYEEEDDGVTEMMVPGHPKIPGY